MRSSIISTTADSISSGGTITGDLTISGDLTVSGDSSGAYSEIITDGLQITKDTDGEFVSLILVNQSDAANTTGIISQRFDLEDTGGTAVDSGKILVGKEASFTATASTQDSYMALHTSLNGTLAEKMRIDSAGKVGIGTAEPQYNLDIRSGESYVYILTAGWQSALSLVRTGGSVASPADIDASGAVLGVVNFSGRESSGIRNGAEIKATTEGVWTSGHYETYMSFLTCPATGTSTIERMRITSAGNVGIGVTPETSHANYTTLQIGGLTSIVSTKAQSADSYTAIANNAYITSGNAWAYIVTDEASLYQASAGVHNFKTAASGSADSAPNGSDWTTNMKIDINSRISLSNNDSSGAVGTTLFGYLAGANIVSGAINNTYIGHGVGDATHTNAADENTGVGYIALGSLTSGNSNTSLGSGSLKTITTGNENVAVGFQSAQLFSNAEIGNISIGANAMNSFNEGGDGGDINYNVALGLEAFLGGSLAGGTNEVIGNIAIGAYALDATGTNAQTGTIAIGYNALTALTSGGYNTVVGYQAAQALTLGGSNTVIGYQALLSMVGTDATNSGNFNVAIGRSAMEGVNNDGHANCEQDGNIAIGYASLYGGTLDGDKDLVGNIAIGNNALNSTGTNAQTGTIAIGHDALTALTSGGNNLAIGYQAGLLISTGTANTIIGKEAGKGFDAESGHTFIGYLAGSGAIDGADECVGIGASALTGALTNGADGAVAIGKSALGALTSGGKNTAIGYNAGAAMTTSDGNTIIGYNAYAAGNNADTTGHNVMIGSGVCDTGTNASITENVFIGYEVAPAVADHASLKNTGVGKGCFGLLESGNQNIAIGRSSAGVLTTGYANIYIGNDSTSSAAAAKYETVVGFGGVGGGDYTTTIGNGGIFKFVSKSVTCDLGGVAENDPAHATAIGKIPRYAVITRVTAVVTTLSSDANHTLKLVLSSDSSGTDNAVLSDVQELIGAGVTESWAGTVTNGASTDINAASGATIKAAYATVAVGTDTGLSSLDTSTEDTYVYLAFADTSHTGGDSNPSTAPVVSVMVEYAGLD
jgi:hypothetical protein